MKTRILSLVVALFATITLYAYDFQYGDLYYNITSESTVEVVHNESYSELTVVVIPSTLYDYYVTSVGDSAFFGCTGLTSITIANRVTSIGYQAFEDCTGLTSVTIGNSVTSIGYETFKGCTGLTSITIPNSVTEIGLSAFSGCTGLTSITIPNSVTEIGWFAFSGCTGLTSITIPNSVTEIGSSAFEGCTGLTSITIPNSVTEIENSAFSGCTGLTSITIPNSVTEIENSAFSGCTGLTSITIPNSVTSIEYGAFEGCTGLTSITIPNSVTSIGDWAFSGCTGLTSVTIGNSVTSIGEAAFFDCTGLTSITIPNSVTSIGDGAFGNVLNIVYYGTATGSPWGARSINGYVDGYLVYEDATQTKLLACFTTATGEITIPNSVTSIEEGAFSGCTGLKKVNYTGDVKGWVSISMKSNPICYSKNLYLNDVLLTDLVLPEGITTMSDAFAYDTCLTSVTIPNSVTEIGWSAFEDCTGLTSITIPNSVTSIGEAAFSGCTGLTSVTIGNSVTSIREEAFRGCTGLTSITIPNSVTSIEYGAFSGCTGLTSIVVENGNKVYDSRSNCNAIIETATNTLIQGCKTTIIPNSVTSIGSGAFSGCTGLTSVIIPNSVTSIEEGAFSGCTGLTSITIPNSVTSIGWAAFSGCTGLTSVLIGNNSELSMDDATFFGYANLTQVTCYANVPPHIYIGQPGYFDEDKLSEKTLYVPLSAIGKYKEADVWKDFGQIVPIGATATDTDEPVIMPSYTEVTIAWPTTIGAKTYTITITKDAKTISSLTFDNTGVLINAAFAAPSYNGNARQAPAAQYAQSAFWFTFSGLECNTQYEYSIVAKSSNGQPISTYNGTFRTTAPTAIDNVSSSSSNNAAVQTRKVFRNGQVLIQHNGKTYTISGNEVK